VIIANIGVKTGANIAKIDVTTGMVLASKFMPSIQCTTVAERMCLLAQ
jgi:hypothetical protein